MITEWKDPNKDKPPIGRPIMVTIKRDWQSHTELLACVAYYLVDPRNGQRHFYEAGDLQNGLIGPEQVKVVAWDYWPDPYFLGDAYAR